MKKPYALRIVGSGTNKCRLEVKKDLLRDLILLGFDIRLSKESGKEVELILDTESKTIQIWWPEKEHCID